MATDVERLSVLIEANTRSYERAMVKLQSSTDKAIRQIKRQYSSVSLKKTEAEVSRLQAVFTRTSQAAGNAGAIIASAFGIGGLGAFAGVALLRGAEQYAEAWVRIENQLKVAGLAGQRLEGTLDSLFATAQRNGTALEPLATLYSRLAQSQRELGASDTDLQRFTEGVSLALRVQGGDAQSASGALLQLSQAMGSAVVRAEEFNSINEGARPILQAVADGLAEAGGSVSKLRNLVIAGKVSNQAFFNAFLAGMGGLQEKAATATQTASQGFTKLRNALTKLSGELGDASGITSGYTDLINSLANAAERAAKNLDDMFDPRTQLANVSTQRLNVETRLAGSNGPLTPAERQRLQALAADLARREITLQKSVTEEMRKSGQLGALPGSGVPGLPNRKPQTVSLDDFAPANAGADALNDKLGRTGELLDGARSAQDKFNDQMQFFGDLALDSFDALILGGEDLNDVLGDLARNLARAALQATLLGQGPLSGLFGTAPTGQNAMGGILGSLFGGGRSGGISIPSTMGFQTTVFPGFATGGSFRVGGSGGADSQLVPLRLSPGEIVDISRPGEGRGGPSVQIANTYIFHDVTPGVEARIRGQLEQQKAALKNEIVASLKKRRANDPQTFSPI